MKAYRTELDPTRAQASLIRQYCGVARFAYNWYLDCAQAYYRENGLFLTGYSFSKALNNSTRPDWFTAAPSKAVKHAIMNAEKAFRRFFNHQGGYPRYKRRGNRDSYYVIGSIHVQRHRIRLPKLGWVRLKEKGYIPTGRTPKSATVGIVNGRCYVSCLYDMDNPLPAPATGEPLGMDVGLKNLAILSDGTVFDNADTSGRIRKLERRKRRLERSLARSRRANQGKDKEHGWHNYRKILLRKRCVEQRLANIRTERMRRVCDELARRQPSSLTIEHLNVKGMMKNRHLAPALHKQALATFLELVEHTCHRHNIELRQVDRWYPSSRLCHECRWKNTGLTLNMRVWRCPMCGSRHDRDVNAALNLRDATEYQLI
ncbi:transposase [Bifidobacterium pseudolongum subsp. globosum]|uniref:RNA-guided endonuclease InsQ/TnpB family protein n=1 Tax=Bifidobacterium pseudolongum TaxID=1694 RepID=UPI00101EC433|nr:RNA-guided endonuclease TnpB family protein [Bifidobacterium pseudolongum]RYQ01220.1 transposase [Bifidobacterium pseudolongum subsp. globosum]